MTKEETKIEEIVDSVSKQEKITEQELNALQITIRTLDRLTADVGRMEVQKFGLLEAMKKSQKEVDEHRARFVEKYGTDNINIQTGDIAYAPEASEETTNTNTQENGEVNQED